MSQSYTNIIDDLRLITAPHPLPWWVWLLLVLLVVSLAYYLVWRKRHPHRRELPPEVVAEKAYEDALAELEKIHQKLAKENSRVYAIGVSAIVRRYIERRFNIHAPSRSTEEFLAEARQSPALSEKYQGKLGYFLSCCDFLKFARGYAEVDELELLHKAAVIFVTETRLASEIKTPDRDAAAAPNHTAPAAAQEVKP